MPSSGNNVNTSPMNPPPPPAPRSKILLVDDHQIVLNGVRAILARTDNLCLIGSCQSPLLVEDFLRQHTPDLILMDISMGESNGLLATRRLHTDFPHIPILIFTSHDEQICASVAESVGAKGLVMKDQPEQEILLAIRTVLQGREYRSPRLPPPLPPAGRLPPPAPSHRAWRKLSPRELEIMDFLVEGLSTAQIALQLHVSLKTVETHRLNIRQKLNITNQNDLVRWAVFRREKGLDL